MFVIAGCTSEGALSVPDAPPDPVEVEQIAATRIDAVRAWDGPAFAPEPPTPPDEDPETAAFFARGTRWDFHLSFPGGDLVHSAVRGELSVDGEEWPAMIQLKGTGSFRDLTGKAAFKLNFVEVDPEARFHGLKRVTLNNMMQDPSMLGEHLAYWLFDRRGVAAPRHTYARVWANGAYYGLYGVVQNEDEQLLARAFPGDDNGNLYEANVADFVTGRTERFEIEETDGMYPPFTDLHALIATVEAASDDDYLATLRSLFQIDRLMNFWAIELVTGNPDGYIAYANNYMAYHGAEHWYLMPWGHDQCFDWQRDVHDFESFDGALLVRCGRVPACRAQLDAVMLAVMAQWEDGELEALAMETIDLIGGDCAADPRAELPCDTQNALDFVRTRPASVREQIDGH